MRKIIIIGFILTFFVLGCSDIFNPLDENITDLKVMDNDPSFAEGVLIDAYTLLPNNSWVFSDLATDNAVSNDINNDILQMAIGNFSSRSFPLSQWKNSFAAIQYLNLFLERVDSVNWDDNAKIRDLFNSRMRGEAYGLRGLFMFYLLRAHAGWTEDGNLLGTPIFLNPLSATSDINLSRASFEESLRQTYEDLDSAIALLPVSFEDRNNINEIPPRYDDFNVSDYNRVFGHYGKQRMSGLIAMAYKSKLALLAASPAFNEGNEDIEKWEEAANYSGEILELNGGVEGLADEGATWYSNASEISNMGEGSNPPEIIWRGNIVNNTDLESQNFPPSLFGEGRINPTQNLVDAFPMENGFPIDEQESNYDPLRPYEGRIPLLYNYILVNGGEFGVENKEITTSIDGETNDALNQVETSTRTGYYLKKLLRQDVNLDPTSVNGQDHYFPRIRYTEIYLNYAEAANEAWGPTGRGAFNFSALDIIKLIRDREGIEEPDEYLNLKSGSKETMRDLIRNTRRIELCFEDFRFWDLRRWNLDLNEPAKGVRIEKGDFDYIEVEERNYKDYMRFGPIPHNEIIKYDSLKQNYGWN